MTHLAAGGLISQAQSKSAPGTAPCDMTCCRPAHGNYLAICRNEAVGDPERERMGELPTERQRRRAVHSSITGRFFLSWRRGATAAENRNKQHCMGEKRAECDGRACARTASGTKHTQRLYHARGDAIQKTQYGHVIVVDRISYRYTRTSVPKVPFCNGHNRGSGPRQRSMHRSASSCLFFFSFLFPMLPTLAFQKVCAGFSGEQKGPAGPARDNFRNVRPRVSRPLADPTRPVFPFVFRRT